ncbi:MAG: BatD family protein [Saprospiraceae bacterium]
MKKAILFFLFVLTASANASAQDEPVKFTVEVSTDSILMGNYFEVKFILENANGQNFEAPDFSENFNVKSGPNFSSSFSIVNGEMTQSQTITYYLEPRDIGSYYILPASVKAGDEVLETAPIEVLVVPNPDGIKQSPPDQMQQFHFDWSTPFNFDIDPPFNDIQPLPLPKPDEKVKPKKKKKKRKTIRI